MEQEGKQQILPKTQQLQKTPKQQLLLATVQPVGGSRYFELLIIDPQCTVLQNNGEGMTKLFAMDFSNNFWSRNTW